jgi:hypothetical protein
MVDGKRGISMIAMTTSGTAKAATGEQGEPKAVPDIVSVRDDRQRLVHMLRAAVGFRVDCPEGRVGVLVAVVPDFGEALPDRIEVATGMFIVTVLKVPFSEVATVDLLRRRVGISAAPERPPPRRRATARRVRRFLRAGGADNRRRPVIPDARELRYGSGPGGDEGDAGVSARTDRRGRAREALDAGGVDPSGSTR